VRVVVVDGGWRLRDLSEDILTLFRAKIGYVAYLYPIFDSEKQPELRSVVRKQTINRSTISL
jgi:hypothetical protein